MKFWKGGIHCVLRSASGRQPRHARFPHLRGEGKAAILRQFHAGFPARRPSGGNRMRQAHLVSIAFALLVAAAAASALAQQQVPLPMQPAAPGPYKPITVTLPPRQSDASLDAFRKDLGDIAKKKDRSALAGKVVTKGFFWQHED